MHSWKWGGVISTTMMTATTLPTNKLLYSEVWETNLNWWLYFKGRILMVTVFDCMPNHGDCTLTHNKLQWLYYMNKNITVTVYNKYKNIGDCIWNIITKTHVSGGNLKTQIKMVTAFRNSSNTVRKLKKGILKTRFFLIRWLHHLKTHFFFDTLKHNFSRWLHFTVFPLIISSKIDDSMCICLLSIW